MPLWLQFVLVFVAGALLGAGLGVYFGVMGMADFIVSSLGGSAPEEAQEDEGIPISSN